MTMPTRQWDGHTIAEPGIYAGIPMGAYHGRPDLCAGPSISSSGLRTIYRDGAAAYWMRSLYNPRRLPEEEKDHFNLGRAAHTLLLSEAGFWDQFVIRPDVYPATPKRKGDPVEERKWTLQANYCKEWEEERKAAGLTILTSGHLEQIRGMAGLLDWQRDMPESGLANSAALSMGLLNGLVEHTIVWQDAETGIWLRARPDLIPTDTIGADLKTTATTDPHKAIRDFGYHAQAALIADGMAAVGMEMSTFVNVFIATTPPHRVQVVEMTTYQAPDGSVVDPIDVGRRENRVALRTFARGMRTGQWPAGDGEVRELRLPDWYRRQVEDAEARAVQPDDSHERDDEMEAAE